MKQTENLLNEFINGTYKLNQTRGPNQDASFPGIALTLADVVNATTILQVARDGVV